MRTRREPRADQLSLAPVELTDGAYDLLRGMGPGDGVPKRVRAQPHEDICRTAEDARLAANLAGVLGRVGGLVDARIVEPDEFDGVKARARTNSHDEGCVELVDGEDLGADAREIAVPGGALDGQGVHLGLDVGGGGAVRNDPKCRRWHCSAAWAGYCRHFRAATDTM